MMLRRAFLTACGGGLVAAIGAGVWSQVPVIPKRPDPEAETAISWIAHREGEYTLTLPRAEMGQNIATALKQIACTELQASWDNVEVQFHDTSSTGIKPTVGSESVMLFAEPLAQACASLRDALASGRTLGKVAVIERPKAKLLTFQIGGLIGASPEIEQGREIVTGASLYAADVMRPGMVYGRVLRAPESVEVESRPANWDIAAALAVPGFVAVVEKCGAPIGKAQGLGIVASRPGVLDAIEEALAVTWATGSYHPHADIESAIDIDAHMSKGALPHNVMKGTPEDGDWDIDLRFDIPLAAHGQIEPRAAVAEWADKNLIVWAGTQDAFYTRDVLQEAYGRDVDRVTVQSCRVGGAFGGKTICTVEAEAAALARAVSAPVKVQWTRAQEFALAFHRPPSSHRIRARVQKGTVTDWDHAQVSSHIMFTSAVVPMWMQAGTDLFAGDGGVARGMAAPYLLGRARASYDTVRLPVHTGPWRGLGAGPNALAIESTMDEAALAAGIDPLEFRLAHVDNMRLANVLTRVCEVAEWGAAPTPALAGERTGRGMAGGIYKGVSYAAAVADVAVDAEGDVRVTRLWCAHDCGMVINPDQVRAQCEGNLVWSIGMILSDALPVENGHVIAESFADADMPRLLGIPPIDIELIASDLPPTGAGETGIVVGPGAIANAIRAATGVRPTRFPVEPEALFT